ncbi:uncharacterized protein [Amphiura filiformis]|uniref:uncharacterized protein n=1 Tax=Amphiura filiformis TaxID=82378 RepID=UPI003B20D1D9
MSVYDPLGLIAPVVLPGKQILQQLCHHGDWDDPIPEEMKTQWDKWRRGILLLGSTNFNIPRCYRPKDFGLVQTIELHHFSDASTVGYGQCSYLRQVDDKQQVHCSLVMGKARVAPLKVTTIPRLELTAALVSVKVSAMLKKELRHQQEIQEIFWTDSKVVLGYIANESRRFHIFVANRVQKIRDSTDPVQWRFVKTDENPADDASRGISAQELTTTSKWLTGPDFLWSKKTPTGEADDYKQALPENDPEVKRIAFATNAERSHHFEIERLERFSTWTRARRAIANCLKFKAHLKSQATMRRRNSNPSKTPIHQYRSPTVEDLRVAEIEIIRSVQLECFNEELQILKCLHVNENTPNRNEARKRNQAIKGTSCLYRLDPYLDEDGIIRVGGRLRRAHFPLEIKHPAILPRKHHITELLIRHCHDSIEHQGRGMTTNEIRSNGFWIIGCSSAVSGVISRCVKCKRLRSKPQVQKMADLPTDRLEPAPPFTYCAVDYFGPFLIKEGRKELKRYGVLFTCLASRAIHIETSASLSTDSFINALRRIIAIRGPIRLLRSDRGTNFVGAEAELKRACLEMDTQRVCNFLLNEKCDYVEFNMNVPSASHMGGVWERQIRTVRNILASLMSEAGTHLDDESLRTFMSEATAIVNSRPLTVDNMNDPMSLEPLTPNHLLTQKSRIILPPPGEFQREDMYLRKWWRRVQYLANEFWSRWRREYLQTLQSRPKWVKPKRDLQTGDIVIIKDEAVLRNRWQLGRVAEVYPGEDGHVRKVKLAIGNKALNSKGKRSLPQSYLERPIHKLVLLLESTDQAENEEN